MKLVAAFVALALSTIVTRVAADQDTKTAIVAAGNYRPLFPVNGQTEIAVAAVRMDRTMVTNADFIGFVKAHPEWRRDRIAAVMAEPGYLAQWSAPDALGAASPSAPVTNVSWFAARAYCGARGMRLPTEAEWEHALSTGFMHADPATDAWEWVSDFGNAVLAFGSGSDRLRFCGATGASASDATDFAAFQRVAFRSSLHASYAIKSLGFRCARDA